MNRPVPTIAGAAPSVAPAAAARFAELTRELELADQAIAHLDRTRRFYTQRRAALAKDLAALLAELANPRAMPLFDSLPDHDQADAAPLPPGQPRGTIGHPIGSNALLATDAIDRPLSPADRTFLLAQVPAAGPPPPAATFVPIDVYCPHCGAQPTAPCSGNDTHARRVDAAAAANARTRKAAGKAAKPPAPPLAGKGSKPRRERPDACEAPRARPAPEPDRSALLEQLRREDAAAQARIEAGPAEGEGFVAAFDRVREDLRRRGIAAMTTRRKRTRNPRPEDRSR